MESRSIIGVPAPRKSLGGRDCARRRHAVRFAADTLVSTPKCDPRDGWTGHGRNLYRYLNYSNALPPACAAGSAQGLQRADFRWTGANHVKVKVKKASLPRLTGPLRVELYRGTGPVNDCDGYVGVANCLGAGTGRAKCSGAY